MEDLRQQFKEETKLSFDAIPIKGVHLEYISWLEKRIEALSLGSVSESEVFEHYGKPFTSGRDLWEFLTAHYNFTPKTKIMKNEVIYQQ